MTKTYRHRFIFRLMVMALASWVVFPAVAAVAQSKADDWQTVAVFSMVSTDEGAPLIKQALTAANHPGLLDEFEKDQREAYATLDFSKPKGILCQTNGRNFRFLAFAAMSDVTKLPYGMGEKISDAEKNRDDWYKIPLSNANQMPVMFQNVFVKQHGDWAFACYGTIQPPKELPDNPVELLQGLEKEYPVALRFNCGAMPKSLVNGYATLGKQFIPMLQMFMPMTHMREQERWATAAALDFFSVFAKETIDQLAKFVNETETVTFGLTGNAESDLITVCKYVAKPGTDTAKAVEQMGGCTTDLIGFYRPDGAIFSQLSVSPIPEYQRGFYKNTLDALVKMINKCSDEVRKEMEQFDTPPEIQEAWEKTMTLVNKAPGVLQATIDNGKFDFAESIAADGATLMAVKIAGGNALLESGNALFDFAQLMMAQQLADNNDPDDALSMPVLGRENYKGIQFWTITIPIPLHVYYDDEDVIDEIKNDDQRQLMGPLTYVIGLSDDTFILANGFTPTVLDTVKKAVDGSGKAVLAPKEIMVFSPHNIGPMIKKFALDTADEKDERAVLNIVFNIPEDANVVVTQEVDGNAATWTGVIDGKLWPTIGAMIEQAIEQSGGELPLPVF